MLVNDDIHALSRRSAVRSCCRTAPNSRRRPSPSTSHRCTGPTSFLAPQMPRTSPAAVNGRRNAGCPCTSSPPGTAPNSAIDGGLLINTRRLQDLQIDPVERTARVGAGVKWRTVLEASVPHGLIRLHGSSTDVGVVGYTLGGGLARARPRPWLRGGPRPQHGASSPPTARFAGSTPTPTPSCFR